MQDISPVLIAACGLSVICVGLILVGAFLLFRFAGIGLIAPILGGLFSRGEDAIGDEPDDDYRSRRQSTSRDIPDPRQGLDFDSAVERYRKQGIKPSSSSQLPRAPHLLNPLPDEDEPSGSLRRDRDRDEPPVIYDDSDSV